MIRSLVEWLASKLPHPRVIYDRNGVSPYLSRYYFLGNPFVRDGSSPFDASGRPHPHAIWPDGKIGLYLHRFHRGDDDGALHNHPWEWAVSFVLLGGYWEERRVGNRVVRHEVRPGTLNFISASDFHRVDLRDGEAWTLFMVGPKSQGWGFWDRVTGQYMPWRQFIDEIRGEL